MAVVAIIVKMMPESLDVDLGVLKENAQRAMESYGAKNVSFEEKPVAFGLKSLHMKMALPESIGTDLVEDVLSKIEGVSSVTIEDYRRAFG